MMKKKALVVSFAAGLSALCIPLAAYAAPSNDSNASSTVTSGSKVVFSQAPITDDAALRDRALHGVTDAPGAPVTVNTKKLGNTQQDLVTKVYTTVQKLKETDNSDGSKVVEYRQTSFITAGDPVTTQTTWDSSYSWENKVTLDYNEYYQGSIRWDQLLSGSSEWDTGGQTTNLPSISNANYTDAAMGPTSTTYFQQKYNVWLGIPAQYTTYTKSQSWPYVETQGTIGEIAVQGQATLSYGGSSWTWTSTAQVGGAQYCC